MEVVYVKEDEREKAELSLDGKPKELTDCLILFLT